MGLAAFGALVTIGLAYLAQSPRLLTRLNLVNERLDLRAKSFTGYGLALLLLALGFFLAGVPLNRDIGSTGSVNSPATETAAALSVAGISGDESSSTSSEPEAGTVVETVGGQSGAMVGLPAASPGGSSGAMSGMNAPLPSLAPDEIISGTVEIPSPASEEIGEAGTTPAAETEQDAAVPTGTATPPPPATPTATPSPTPTATPIRVPTAKINDQTSTLPIRRLPGGTPLVILVRGDVVIPLTGNAFYKGELWQEVKTVAGIVGWVQDRFLDYGDS